VLHGRFGRLHLQNRLRGVRAPTQRETVIAGIEDREAKAPGGRRVETPRRLQITRHDTGLLLHGAGSSGQKTRQTRTGCKPATRAIRRKISRTPANTPSSDPDSRPVQGNYPKSLALGRRPAKRRAKEQNMTPRDKIRNFS